jgi:splicing factor 45
MEKRRRIEEEKQRKANEPKVEAPPKEDDFATKMMKKMGWKEGVGLGKDGQGITAPLMAKKTDKNVAVIEQAPAKPVAPKPTPGTNFNRQPTRVVMLTNMVGKGEIDEDLADETKDEAGKYGEIKSVNCVDVPNARDDQAVRIFINFSTAESATKALLGFNGRFFGGRTVLARFFSPDLYDKGDYLADPQAG